MSIEEIRERWAGDPVMLFDWHRYAEKKRAHEDIATLLAALDAATAERDKVRDEAANLLMEKLRFMLANDSLRTERDAATAERARLAGLCDDAVSECGRITSLMGDLKAERDKARSLYEDALVEAQAERFDANAAQARVRELQNRPICTPLLCSPCADRDKRIAELEARVRCFDDVRPEVKAFAVLMEAQLRKNDHKGGWKGCSVDYLVKKLLEELAELYAAVYSSVKVAIAPEAADLANFAMMLCDVEGALERVPAPCHPELPKVDTGPMYAAMEKALEFLKWADRNIYLGLGPEGMKQWDGKIRPAIVALRKFFDTEDE